MSTFGWLFKATRGFTGALVASGLQRILGLVAYLAMVCAAVVAISERDWRLVWLVIGFGLLKALLRYGEQFCGHWVAFKVLEQLRAQAFAALATTVGDQGADTDRRTTGDIVERLTKDIDRLEVFYAHTLVPILSAGLAPFIAAAATCAATGNGAAAAITIASGLVVWVAAATGLAPMFRANEAMALSRGTRTHQVTDAVFGHAEVVGYHMQEGQLARIADTDNRLLQATGTLARWSGVRAGLSAGASLGGASLLVSSGMPWPEALMAALITLTACMHVAAIEQLAPSLSAALASARRVRHLAQPPMNTPPHPWPGGVCELMAPGLNGGQPLTLAPGDYAVITGPSGVGKTRLLRSAMTFDAAGTVTIGGIDVRSIGFDQLRCHVMFVPQKAVTFPGTVRFNLTLGAKHADAEIARVLDIVELGEHVAERGLDSPMGQWSGGQLARVEIARALLAKPEILLLDEPTAHLDRALAARVRLGIRTYLPQAIIVEIAHDPDSIPFAHQHVVFADS